MDATEAMAWWIPFLIFAARICDVSMGTVRTMMVVNGSRLAASILGFLEVIIWVLAVAGALRYLPNPFAVVAYGAGYAVGVLVGMMIEDKLAVGYRAIRVINPDQTVDLAPALRERGYRVTRVPGYGREGPVEMLFLVIRRRTARTLLRELAELAPKCFVTVERVDRPSGGGFDRRGEQRPLTLAASLRK